MLVSSDGAKSIEFRISIDAVPVLNVIVAAEESRVDAFADGVVIVPVYLVFEALGQGVELLMAAASASDETFDVNIAWMSYLRGRNYLFHKVGNETSSDGDVPF